MQTTWIVTVCMTVIKDNLTLTLGSLMTLELRPKSQTSVSILRCSTLIVWCSNLTVKGRGPTVTKGERLEEICIHEHEHTMPVNKRQEKNTHRGHVMSISTLDVLMPLVICFFLKSDEMNFICRSF